MNIKKFFNTVTTLNLCFAFIFIVNLVLCLSTYVNGYLTFLFLLQTIVLIYVQDKFLNPKTESNAVLPHPTLVGRFVMVSKPLFKIGDHILVISNIENTLHYKGEVVCVILTTTNVSKENITYKFKYELKILDIETNFNCFYYEDELLLINENM